MKKQILAFSAVVAAVLFPTTNLFSQGFEGTIEFKKISSIDTIQYIYYVKGDNVRIDEIGSDKRTAGTMLVNIKDGSAKSLSPERKLYLDVEKGKQTPVAKDKVKIEKGKGVKTIAGYKCNEVVVKNSDENTVITYYIAKDNFHFLTGVIKSLNRKDKISTHYQLLSDIDNSFPFLAVETDFSGTKKSSLEVIAVNKHKIESSIFQIPAGYKKFEK